MQLLWKAIWQDLSKLQMHMMLVPVFNSGILFYPSDRMCEVTGAKVTQCGIICARKELKTGCVPNNKGLVKKIYKAVQKNEVLY